MSRFDQVPSEGRTFFGLIAGGIAVVFFLIFAFSTYYTVDQGERGVVLHYGAVSGTAEPGLGFKFPFVTSIQHISLRQQAMTFNNEQTYSADQQPAAVKVSVNYHVTDVVALYTGYRDIDTAFATLVTPKVREQLRNIFGKFNAVEAIQHRDKLNTEVFQAIAAAIKGPIMIDSVQIENINFSDKYERAVEERMEATVHQQKAEADKQKRIINADAAAYEVKAQADAQAHAIEVRGAAEAKAIKLRGDALRENPGLPLLVAAERWDGKLPTTMPPGGSVPFIQVK